MLWFDSCLSHIDRTMTAIEKAKQLGTYNALDRSQQYTVHDADLVKAVNQAWTKIRTQERTTATKDDVAALRKQIESRIWHRIVVIVAAAEFTLIVMLLEKFAK